MKCRKTGEYTGIVRLVLPDPVDTGKPLPMERLCSSAIRKAVGDLANVPRERVAEISRFSVSRQLRSKCVQSADSPVTAGSVNDRNHIDVKGSCMLPHITLGLFAGIMLMSERHGITHFLAIIEPRLLRLLSRYGIYFHKTGPVIDHHGQRQPVMANIDMLLSGIYAKRRDVWEIITDCGKLKPDGQVTKHLASA